MKLPDNREVNGMRKKGIRVRVAGLLHEKGGVLLVCHEKKGKQYWLLPGGGVQFGETIEEALKREFLEETNLRIKVGKLIIVNETVAPDRSRHGLHLTFLVKKLSGELRATPDERLRFARFVEWKKIPRLSLFPRIGKILLEFREKKFAGDAKFLGNIWIP